MNRLFLTLFLIACSCLVTDFAQSREVVLPAPGQSLSAAEIKAVIDLPAEERKAVLRQFGSDETVMVPMRDGVRLSTTYYRIPFAGRTPTIVVRTPYGKEEAEPVALLVLLAGYSFVVQDSRGRGNSEGEDLVFQSDGWGELQDGYDTIQWAAQQSWSNEKIGTWGYSAFGITANMTAAALPPNLLCQVLGFEASKGWGQVAYQGGVLRREIVNSWLVSKGSGHMLPVFLSHPTKDAFWEQYDVEARYPLINVPALFVGGLFDPFLEGTLHNFVGRQTLGAEGSRGNNKLILGAWTHVKRDSAAQGQLSLPLNAIWADEIKDTVDWFDYWLKDKKDNDMSRKAPVTYYVFSDPNNPEKVGNVWKTTDTWPPKSQRVPFYLQPDRSLSLIPSGLENSLTEFVYDPLSPVPTLGGNNLDIAAGPVDQASIEQRSDTVEFTSPPLAEPLEVTGQVIAVLYAATDLTDTDLTVRLTDVYPDGRSMLICDGILRASFRESDTNPTPIMPGQAYRYEIDLWSTSVIFAKGHRVRITVANSNYPRFELNPAYTPLETAMTTTTTHIYHSPQYPSQIVLPVVSGLPAGVRVVDWAVY